MGAAFARPAVAQLLAESAFPGPGGPPLLELRLLSLQLLLQPASSQPAHSHLSFTALQCSPSKGSPVMHLVDAA